MIIGIPKEIKNHEYRVGLTPAAVAELTANDHQVLVEHNAGDAIGFTNEHYSQAGAQILSSANEIFAQAALIIKVKEPQPEECELLRPQQIIFTYLHLAADKSLTKQLIKSQAVCLAYETVVDEQGNLPLLAPMSEVAGRMSIQAGAHALEKSQGGLGLLLGGVAGIPPAKVLIIGGGVVGTQAARIALGMGADVSILDKALSRLRQLDSEFLGQVKTVYSTASALDDLLTNSDLVVGAVLIPGAAAPKLITKKHLKLMKNGCVIVDVAIDQGGCAESSKPTTHESPTYIVDGVVHYCVANIPGAVPLSSTQALTNATLPYIINLANLGIKQALCKDTGLLSSINIAAGQVTNQAVAKALGFQFIKPEYILDKLCK